MDQHDKLSPDLEKTLIDRMLDSMGIGLYVSSGDGTVLYMNPIAREILETEDQYAPVEMRKQTETSGLKIQDLLAPEYLDIFEANIQKQHNHPDRLRLVELKINTPKGKTKWISHKYYTAAENQKD